MTCSKPRWRWWVITVRSWSDTLTLILPEPPDTPTNKNGFANKSDKVRSRFIFGNKLSAGQSEFYKSNMAGIKVEMVFEVHAFEYENEPYAEYGGKRYKVLRTYESKNTDVVELVLSDLSERGGGLLDGFI